MNSLRIAALEERVEETEYVSASRAYEGPDVTEYRSYSEQMIGDTLENAGIKFVYEDRVYVEEGDEKRGRLWYPDFHLTDSGVFIEYVGRPDDKEYMKGIEKKKEVYLRMGANVVWLYPEDIWDESDGRYEVRKDAENHILKSVHAQLDSTLEGKGLRQVHVDAKTVGHRSTGPPII